MSIKSLKYVKKSALKCFEFLPYKSKNFAQTAADPAPYVPILIVKIELITLFDH